MQHAVAGRKCGHDANAVARQFYPQTRENTSEPPDTEDADHTSDAPNATDAPRGYFLAAPERRDCFSNCV